MRSNSSIIPFKLIFMFSVYVVNVTQMYSRTVFKGQEWVGSKSHELSHNPAHFSDEEIEGQRGALLSGGI